MRRAVSLLLLTMLVQREKNWVGGPSFARADRLRRVAESAASAGSTDGAEPAHIQVHIFYPAEKKRLWRLMLAFTSEAPR